MPTQNIPPVPITPLVVTPDDYNNMFCANLAELLRGSTNDSNYPFVFLRIVQEYLMDWCDDHGFRRVHFSELQGMQLAYFQKAVLYQTYYAIKNGAVAIGLDSGYDAEKGKIIDATSLDQIGVPARVVTLLHKSGLFNLKMKNRPRYNRGYPGLMGVYTGEDY